jgi:hypothetical protein
MCRDYRLFVRMLHERGGRTTDKEIGTTEYTEYTE